MQNYKWLFLRCLLSRHRKGKDASSTLRNCLLELKARDKEMRNCYSEDFDPFNSNELASIMLLDGAFIIYLLLRRLNEEDNRTIPNGREKEIPEKVSVKRKVSMEEVHEKESMVEGQEKGKRKVEEEDKMTVVLDIGDEKEDLYGPLQGNMWSWYLVVYDLLKLENQIPFFIIIILFDFLQTPNNTPIDLANLALGLFSDIHPIKSKRFLTMPQPDIHHLLHLFHSSILINWEAFETAAAHAGASTFLEWIPPATELAMAGVRFKRKEKFNSFLDVSYHNGVLKMPPLRVSEYTGSIFRNLVAFEHCYPNTNACMTIYAIFMDRIIDSAEDVRLLDLKGILINRLSTDDEMACLFNQLCHQVHYDPQKNYLNYVLHKLMKYHESKWHRWRAGLVRDYFSNPWSIISVLAAVLLLLLTIEQSFFTAYSYFRPP